MLLSRLYESLTRSDPPAPADLIVVLAGRMDRKPYGLELYRAGLAPRLLLSVGRFEVSRMASLGIEGVDSLLEQRNLTAPGERHFFYEISADGVRIEKARLRRWSTYGEALALREYTKASSVRRMLVVSTDIHLRRVALTFGKVFRTTRIDISYCPVPDTYCNFNKHNWWNTHATRKYVLKEVVKLIGYRIILSLPQWMTWRAMLLKP